MVIVADSGSSSTTWAIISKNSEIKILSSQGLNPLHITQKNLLFTINSTFDNKYLNQNVEKVLFYGAGCLNKNINSKLALTLKQVFPNSSIKIDSDIKAAAIALFGNKQGIACIIGTGANSAIWDGKDYKTITAPLGFILGDEGSGTYIGKKIFANFLRKNFSEDLLHKIREFIGCDEKKIIENIYRNKASKVYIASIIPFVYENIENPELKEIVYNSFLDFVNVFIKNKDLDQNLKIGFCGSVAFYFKDILENVLLEKKLKLHKIIQNPIFNLIENLKHDKIF